MKENAAEFTYMILGEDDIIKRGDEWSTGSGWHYCKTSVGYTNKQYRQQINTTYNREAWQVRRKIAIPRTKKGNKKIC